MNRAGDDDEPTKWDARLIELDRKALDAAYSAHVQKLFAVWMSDWQDQPQRAMTGARLGREAYIRAMTEIDKREALLKAPD